MEYGWVGNPAMGPFLVSNLTYLTFFGNPNL